MFVKSMVIDGFKSYGKRTEINGFDPLFNAITGLNGSGKSNILDAICFLLGITNLTQVRATNLQDLVYKNGQAGITKATVSIIFDNRDKKQTPINYEQYDEITVTRQVVVGGKNKYLINGVNANTNRVQDLFRSVQLNVNNPHFLIMQGRITKVLNMKPPEILSMIEEAAGTRMYESKKQSALKTMEKKDAKLREIDEILNERINPTLVKLREERQAYMEYTKVTRELDHLSKLYIAWQFFKTEELCQNSQGVLEELKETILGIRKEIEENQGKIKDIEKEIEILEKKKDEETGEGLARLEDVLKEKQMGETKVGSDVQHTKDRLKEENKRKKELQKHIDEDNTSAASKRKQIDKLQKQMNELQEASKKDSEALAAAQKHFQAVSAGLSSGADGEEATITEQLRVAKNTVSEIKTRYKQTEMALKHAQSQVKEREAECKKTESSYKKDEATVKELEKKIKMSHDQMSKLSYNEGSEETLFNQKRELQRDLDNIRRRIDTFEARYPHMTLHYNDPERNFNRRRVHGLVCDLFTMKDPKSALALETIAGGRLYNIVVDNEETGKLLLKHGGLKRRCTIIPLNKIIGRNVEPHIVKRAENLVGKDNVCTAVSLINSEPQFAEAMKFVFGGVLVCNNMNNARVVAFDNSVMKKTVTFDGESFDPSGVISGGALAQGPSTLQQLAEINQIRQELSQKEHQFNKISSDLSRIKAVAEKYHSIKQDYELKQTELEHLKSRLEQGTHHQLLQEYEGLKQSIQDQKQTLEQCKKQEKETEAKVKELELKIKDAKSIREKELKAAEQAIGKCKSQAEASVKSAKEKEQEVASLNLDIEDLQKGLTGYSEQIASVDAVIKEYEEKLEYLKENLEGVRKEVAEATANVKAQKAKLKSQCEEINQKYREKDGCQKAIADKKLQIQELEHKVTKTTKEAKDAASKLDEMAANYEWILNEKRYFGKPNTDYDFTQNDPKEAGRRIQKLTETKEKLSRNVNTRAQNMLGKTEEEYQSLIKKKQIVENDKTKIWKTIEELDGEKNLAVQEAWKKVNVDFGSIFSTLLPGTHAKLIPPEGMSVLDGLEVKVAFGDVWKESLTELSGGQRSLVALSLILALLLFKPAPIYILDEVDAALDISHTQNIGHMLRTHFKHSQFIVVSLKDGMFNNANVLFKTKFVDGSSTVTRFAQRISGGKPD